MAKQPEWQDPRLTPDWTEKVLADLGENGVFDGKPTTKALNRYIRTLFRIVKSQPTLVSAFATPADNFEKSLRGASCTYELQMITPDGIFETWGGAADAFPDNLEGKFRAYPAAMAETRALGRALTKALNLNCITYEEVQGNDVDELDKTPASDLQWEKFDRDFAEFNISAQKFFSYHGKSVGLKEISSMNKGQVIYFFSKINLYKQGNPVEEKLLGYDAKWLERIRK